MQGECKNSGVLAHSAGCVQAMCGIDKGAVKPRLWMGPETLREPVSGCSEATGNLCSDWAGVENPIGMCCYNLKRCFWQKVPFGFPVEERSIFGLLSLSVYKNT